MRFLLLIILLVPITAVAALQPPIVRNVFDTNSAPALSGDITTPGSSLVTTLKNTGTAGTYRSVTTDAAGRITSGTAPTTFGGYAISDSSANLAAALTDEVGSGGGFVRAISPTIVTPTIADLSNMTHTHQNAAGGGTLDAAAIASGTFADARLSANVSLLGQTISLSEIANISTGVLLGRSTAGSGVPETLSIGGGLTLAGGVLSALGDATLVPTTITPTNFVLNTVYTNGSGVVQDLSVSAALTVAAVTGDASLDLMVDQAGGTTFALGKRIGIGTTIAVTLAGTYTNSIAHSISNLATYYFTNSSAGSGNSSSIVPGTGQIVSIGDGSVIGITNLQSGNTLSNLTVGGTFTATGNATVGGTLGAITASSLSVTGAVPGAVKLTDSGGGLRAQLGTNDNLLLTNATTAWIVRATNGGITVSSNIVAAAYYGDGSHLTGIASGGMLPTQRGVAPNTAATSGANAAGVSGGNFGTENQVRAPVGAACTITNLYFHFQLNAAMGVGTNAILQLVTNGVACTTLRCILTGDGSTTEYVTNDLTGSIPILSGTNLVSISLSNNAAIPNCRPTWSFQTQ